MADERMTKAWLHPLDVELNVGNKRGREDEIYERVSDVVADLKRHASENFSEAQTSKPIASSKAGVGIIVELGSDGSFFVTDLVEGGPAQMSGQIPRGVMLTHVNGASLEGWSIHELANMIQGPPGTEVVLSVCSPTRGRIDVSLIRGVKSSPESSPENIAPSAERSRADTPAPVAHWPELLPTSAYSQDEADVNSWLEQARAFAASKRGWFSIFGGGKEISLAALDEAAHPLATQQATPEFQQFLEACPAGAKPEMMLTAWCKLLVLRRCTEAAFAMSAEHSRQEHQRLLASDQRLATAQAAAEAARSEHRLSLSANRVLDAQLQASQRKVGETQAALKTATLDLAEMRARLAAATKSLETQRNLVDEAERVVKSQREEISAWKCDKEELEAALKEARESAGAATMAVGHMETKLLEVAGAIKSHLEPGGPPVTLQEARTIIEMGALKLSQLDPSRDVGSQLLGRDVTRSASQPPYQPTFGSARGLGVGHAPQDKDKCIIS